jgi:L-ascorbate metabolism protein UlaG (beta-lactamase superfamily)
MSELTIAYYGHSCFRLAYEDDTLVFDPYEDGSVPGWCLPKNITAHHIICSHDHADHNASDLIHPTGGSAALQLSSFMVPHDDANGAKRGMCQVTMVQAGKTKLVHMGDIGRLPTAEEYEKLSGTDVLLIPCGGYFTIDAAQAAEIAAHVRPALTILMHYRDGDKGYEVTEDISTIAAHFPGLKRLDETSISFADDDVPAGVITLNAIQ